MMSKRFVAIWFPRLQTDWFIIRCPELHKLAFVIAAPDHGRMRVIAVNSLAQTQGVSPGMAVADARAIISSLQVLDEKPALTGKLLTGLAKWCIRYTPFVAIDQPDGLILDATGCAHLWGGENNYLENIRTRLKNLGYQTRIAIADTIGTAWAISRFGQDSFIVKSGQQMEALLSLPPIALRLETDSAERLQKLGLRQIKDFIAMPRSVLRQRFGKPFIQRLNQALGHEEEPVQPVQPVEPYQERLNCLEPIVTATGIEIALQRLLEKICGRLQQEQKGLRMALLKCYRLDSQMEQIEIGTHRPSHNSLHLFKLFELKISGIEPGLGIELFVLEAQKIEDASPVQERLWDGASGLDSIGLSELLDRLAGKIGVNQIHRYIPDEHYWPERSVKPASSLGEQPTTGWKIERPRPLQLLSTPERIEVTAPVPDYPPMLFRYKKKLHKVIRADGPERIEPEWWLQDGQHRDYYYVEDEEGNRYWLFRLGHYSDKIYQWFIHGFFA